MEREFTKEKLQMPAKWKGVNGFKLTDIAFHLIKGEPVSDNDYYLENPEMLICSNINFAHRNYTISFINSLVLCIKITKTILLLSVIPLWAF